MDNDNCTADPLNIEAHVESLGSNCTMPSTDVQIQCLMQNVSIKLQLYIHACWVTSFPVLQFDTFLCPNVQ